MSVGGLNISLVVAIFVFIISFFDIIFILDSIYNIVIGSFGLFPKNLPKDKIGNLIIPSTNSQTYPQTQDLQSQKLQKLHKFVLIICAHNEQFVIGNTLEQMIKVKYPKSLLKVVVVCDNCSDQTAKIANQIAHKLPFEHKDFITVLERSDKVNKGKPFAVKFAFDWIDEHIPDYEAVSIADADNIYHLQFFEVMNWRLCTGSHILQGYLGIKNPYDSWVSTGSTLSYSASALVYFASRENLNMSSTVGGTGFVLSRYILKKVGWDMGSLTEDLEFSTKAVLMGEKIDFAYDAITYDEKPTDLRASYHQRKRWMQGHHDVAQQYIWKLLKALFNPKTKNRLSVFDYTLYLIRPIKKMWYAYFFSAIVLVYLTNSFGFYQIDLVPKDPIIIWLILAMALILEYSGAILEGFKWWKLPHILYYYTIFNLNDYLATFAGIFLKTKKGVWVKTEHKITTTVEAIAND